MVVGSRRLGSPVVIALLPFLLWVFFLKANSGRNGYPYLIIRGLLWNQKGYYIKVCQIVT